MSKPSMRCGRPGRPSARWSSSSDDLAGGSTARERWVWSASAAFSSAIATSSRFRPRWGDQELHPAARAAGRATPPSSAASGTPRTSRISRGGDDALARRTAARRPRGSRRRSSPRAGRRRTTRGRAAGPCARRRAGRRPPTPWRTTPRMSWSASLGRDDLLALADRVQRLDLVAQDGGPLELRPPRPPPPSPAVSSAARSSSRPSRNALDLPHRPRVPLARLPPGARARCSGGCSTGGTAAAAVPSILMRQVRSGKSCAHQAEGLAHAPSPGRTGRSRPRRPSGPAARRRSRGNSSLVVSLRNG